MITNTIQNTHFCMPIKKFRITRTTTFFQINDGQKVIFTPNILKQDTLPFLAYTIKHTKLTSRLSEFLISLFRESIVHDVAKRRQPNMYSKITYFILTSFLKTTIPFTFC